MTIILFALRQVTFVWLAICLPISCQAGQGIGVHLFILSGQSNMVRLNADNSFVPIVTEAFGEGNVVVVKDAHGGQAIKHWYKQKGGKLYTRLIYKVKLAIKHKKVETVTFIWMQGERDAAEGYSDTYKASFDGIIQRLRMDLQRRDINFVIGRISDFDMSNSKFRDWTKLREIQVELAESDYRGKWIDTDDLNDGLDVNGVELKNDLHYSIKGYEVLGTRFAEKAIELIRDNVKQDDDALKVDK